MLQRLREQLTLALLALLPFHAFLVTVATKFISGPGHAPLPVLALWKEALLVLILSVAIIEILKQFQVSGFAFRVDWIDSCIIALLFSSIIPIIFNFQFSIFNYILGFKYDFIPLIAFLILRRVQWSSWFFEYVGKMLLYIGIVIAAFGIISFFLPLRFFTLLGYSDLHSLYVPGGPLAPFQQIGGFWIRRIQSVMSGPNQLGLWLLIPLSILLYKAIQGGENYRTSTKVQLIIIVLAIFLAFSRAAWLAAAILILLAAFLKFPRPGFYRFLMSMLLLGFLFVITILLIAPHILTRSLSSRGHWEHPMHALQLMAQHPLGLGLGTAGPASNRTSDPCVFLEAGSDVSWAEAHPGLCVFMDFKQVLPIDRTCHCPLLTENWYLQIGVELGLAGFILFVTLIVLILCKLFSMYHLAFSIEGLNAKWEMLNGKLLLLPTVLSFLGLTIAALFLHAWEDSAVAYSIWILLATALPVLQSQTPRKA